MDNNAVAKKLAALGRKRASLMRQLERVDAEQCELLKSCMDQFDLSDEVIAFSVAPKDDD